MRATAKKSKTSKASNAPKFKKTAQKSATTRKPRQAKAEPATPALSSSSSSPTSDPTVQARVAALSAAFTALGARDPQRWAQSQIDHGLDQIGRFVFLRAAWAQVASAKALKQVDKQGGDGAALLHKLRRTGVSDDDLVAFGRMMQVKLLVDLCQTIDDPSDNDEGIRWGLWRMDKRGLPLWQLPDLRLDVLEVDPADDE
jgi:hypothetical protein